MAKKMARKVTKKSAKKTAKKLAKKVAKKKSARQAIESVVRRFATRPKTELASELENKEYGLDLHVDPAVAEQLRGTESAEAVAQWRVAKSLLKLRVQVNTMAPNRSKASDGTIGDTNHCGNPGSTSDHCPRISDGGVGVVAAMDITHDPAHGCDAGVLAKAIRASRDSRVKYIIWNRHIANSSPVGGSEAWAWRNYTGANPHDHHVHISVKPNKPQYDSESSWSLTGGEA